MTKRSTFLLVVIGAVLLAAEGRILSVNRERSTATFTTLPHAATNIVGKEVSVANDHSIKPAHHDHDHSIMPSHHGISVNEMAANIIADLCPHGMLHLAYGLACGGPTGIIPAVVLVAVFGAMSAYSMVVLAHLSKEVGAESIGDLWGRLKSPSSKWLIDASIMMLCYGCCVFSAATVGDIFGDFMKSMGKMNIPRSLAIALPVNMLLPNLLADDLSGLQSALAMGTAGIFYTVLLLVKRWLDQTYAPGSYFLKYVDPELRPHFTSSLGSKWSKWFHINSGTLVLVNMLSIAFLAQHHAIPYLRELNTPEQYQKGIAFGFGITSAVFLTMMFIGYKMFGNAAHPLILNNFAEKDTLANVARFCVGVAMVLAFFMAFIPLKSAMFALIDAATASRNRSPDENQTVSHGGPDDSSQIKKWKFASALVTWLSITKIAEWYNTHQVASFVSIVVSALGCLVAYILPNYLSILHNHQRQKAGLTTNRREVAMNYFMAILGALLSILGVWMTITNTGGHH